MVIHLRPRASAMTERQPPAFAGEGSGEARDVVLIVDAIDAHRPSPPGGSPGTGEGSSRLRSEGSGIVSPTVFQTRISSIWRVSPAPSNSMETLLMPA